MARTSLFDNFARAVRIACLGEQERISTTEAIERVAEIEERAERRLGARREFLADAGRVAAIGMLASLTNPRKRVYAAASPNVGIVGAGLAGLACTDTLRLAGIQATVYEVSTSIGGRCTSLRGVFRDEQSSSGASLSTSHTRPFSKMCRADYREKRCTLD